MKKAARKKIKFIIVRVFFVLSLGILVVPVVLVRNFLKESDLFIVKEVITNIDISSGDSQGNSKTLKEVVNKKSIFSVDIEYIAEELRKNYPEYKGVLVYRRFPDTLYVEYIERIPFVKIIISGASWILDKNFVVISRLDQDNDDAMLTLYPLLPKGLRVAKGKALALPYSSGIVSLVEELIALGFLGDYAIDSLYAYSRNEISFDLEGIAIKVGDGHYNKKLSLLKSLILPRFIHDLDKLEYIDLRFKDYVVGYKR